MRKSVQYRLGFGVSSSMKWCLFFFLIMSSMAWGQREKPQNYRRFDERLFHFGFMLGGNSSGFTLYQKPDAYEMYKLKSLIMKPGVGGQLGIVTTMKVGTPVVRLRFIPTLSFQERILQYTFEKNDTTDLLNEERINSTSLDFPLMFQFRTLRVNNFASYILLGAQYSVDLQSQEDDTQDFIDPFIKLKRHDWQGQIGAGVEFFAPYFKFGMEIKFSHGFINSYVPDNTFIGNPIEKTYNRVWWFSIIFEG